MRSTCALTGHRQLPSGFDKNRLYDTLEELIKGGCDTFLCGMAEGFDLLALDCLVGLRQKYKFYIEACIPFEGQEDRFAFSEKWKYHTLIDWCDKKTVLFGRYQNGCYLARDRYMVDCADFLLAYCMKNTGGTAYTVKYAKEKAVPVINLYETR